MQERNEQGPRQDKAPYTKPELSSHGTVELITLQSRGSNGGTLGGGGTADLAPTS